MTITIKFFATYRDIAGTDTLELHIDDAATVVDVIELLEQQYPKFSGKLRTNTLVAVNEKYIRREQALRPNDTVVFFPPVSGG